MSNQKEKRMANNAKQVIDMHVSKGITTAQSNEHQRRWTEKGWESAVSKGNYDPTREKLNFEIVKGGLIQPVNKQRSIPERMAAILQERGIKDPNEGLEEPKYRTVVNFIFGGSRERMRELAFGNQEVNFDKGSDNSGVTRKAEIEEWAKDVYSFVCKKYSEQNIAAFIVHLDEQNPHIHCTLLPIQDGKFAYKKMFAGKDKYEFSERMKQLHNEFAEVNSKWGLTRGNSISETGAKHRTTEEYRRHLSEQCTTIEQQIMQHQKALSDLHVEIRLAERRVKGLTSMVENLTREKTEKESEISALNQKLSMQQGNEDTLRSRIEKLNQELSTIQSKLTDKQSKLEVADQKLSELKEDMIAIGERKDELKEEAIKYSKNIHIHVDTLLKDVVVERLVKEHQSIMTSLTPDSRNSFDESLIESLAQRGSGVMHCATLLFLGLVDDATTFAESNGGGGTKSDMAWGRDKDENDRDWARRCMMMATHMMKPVIGKKTKR